MRLRGNKTIELFNSKVEYPAPGGTFGDEEVEKGEPLLRE
jgi:hypothetical protein